MNVLTDEALAGRRLMRTDQVAGMLQLTERTLASWRQRGGGPKYIRVRAGNRAVRAIRYRLADVEQWIKDREATSTSDSGPEADSEAA